MIFKLITSGDFYPEHDKIKLEKLGFKFKKSMNDMTQIVSNENHYKIENNSITIEINNLSELMKVIEEYGDIIISKNTIEIYDSYREW